MPDQFDPYRERLVMEMETIWPESLGNIPSTERTQIAEKLHSAADQCASIEYVRTHTGFCRKIMVTESDLARVRGK